MQLIIPMAGRSSRFPDLKPKWMLTHPNGKFMVLEAISGLDLDQFERINFVYLQEHEVQYKFLKGFHEELEFMGLSKKVNMIALDQPTIDQPETVQKAIELANIKGPIFIKDSDNFFKVPAVADNHICYCNLNGVGLIKPKNKSYVSINNQQNVVNIVEKQVISSTFCIGGYGFRDADQFVSTLKKLSIKTDRYISNVIYQMLLDGDNFRAIEGEEYSDWGTVEDWDRYKRSFGTLFVDLDGTLVKNSSWHFPPYIGDSEPLQSNIDIVKTLQKSGKFDIIITTSRPERYRAVTEKQLASLGITCKQLLMGLQHSKRIIVNDYSKSNPFKSCDSINLKRDTNDLKEMLRESLGIDYEEI